MVSYSTAVHRESLKYRISPTSTAKNNAISIYIYRCLFALFPRSSEKKVDTSIGVVPLTVESLFESLTMTYQYLCPHHAAVFVNKSQWQHAINASGLPYREHFQFALSGHEGLVVCPHPASLSLTLFLSSPSVVESRRRACLFLRAALFCHSLHRMDRQK